MYRIVMKKFIIHKFYICLNLFRLFYFKLRYNTYRNQYNIDNTFKFNGIDIEFYGNGKIIIGKNCYIGNRSTIASVEGQKVVIGNYCNISHNVRIYTSNRDPNDIIFGKTDITYKKADVIIGDNCWIGANVFINQGVQIGDNVVIGANSVVTKNFPSNVVIAGVPARIIKYGN